MTYRPIDEPAEMSALKFPCRTTFPGPICTFLNLPARGDSFSIADSSHSQEEVDLPLDMSWYLPPPLLEALHRLGRDPEQSSQLTLGLRQVMPDLG